MLNSLDLFSGIGGIAYALQGYAKPIAYCEIDEYCRRVLIERMDSTDLPRAPIFNDVKKLQSKGLDFDIITAGFPCQDISSAGHGVGLEGERSRLFFEIIRLVKEANPIWVFLENVPAIRTKGLTKVIESFSDLGYDCRWTCVSAQEVGAPHLRKRWFMLAKKSERSTSDPNGIGLRNRKQEQRKQSLSANIEGPCDERSNSSLPNTKRTELRLEQRWGSGQSWQRAPEFGVNGQEKQVADTERKRLEGKPQRETRSLLSTKGSWWDVEPNVGRVANGVPSRVDRIKGLGNAVVPSQCRLAFERLAGF